MKATRVLSAPRSLLMAGVALLALALLGSPASAQQSNDTPGAPIGLVVVVLLVVVGLLTWRLVA